VLRPTFSDVSRGVVDRGGGPAHAWLGRLPMSSNAVSGGVPPRRLSIGRSRVEGVAGSGSISGYWLRIRAALQQQLVDRNPESIESAGDGGNVGREWWFRTRTGPMYWGGRQKFLKAWAGRGVGFVGGFRHTSGTVVRSEQYNLSTCRGETFAWELSATGCTDSSTYDFSSLVVRFGSSHRCPANRL